MTIANNLAGQRFTRLLVIGRIENHICLGGASKVMWRCICDCGAIHAASADSLQRGGVRSCGCLARELAIQRLTTHGRTRTRAYRIWVDMIKRCKNTKTRRYQDYGGRGIKVADRWLDFKNFIADMGDPPDGLSLERADNNGDYKPGNCLWADDKTQQRNKRSNLVVTHRGVTACLTEHCEHLGLNYEKVRQRLKKLGWTAERAFAK